MADNDLLHRAVTALATVCDGARHDDAQGFNGYDSEFGHSLARRPWINWTPRQKTAAYRMLKKYRRQLQGLGINFDDIAEPRIEEWRPSGVASVESRKIEMYEGGFIIRFSYDSVLVQRVKEIAGARWDGFQKYWTVPANPLAADALLTFAKANHFRASSAIHLVLGELAAKAAGAKMNVEASRAATSDFHVEGLGGELRGFQRAGVEYATRAERCMIADEMGLGKTVQALAAIQHWQAFPAVIVCPASLKLNWQREANIWIPGKFIKVWDAQKGYPADINIINYDVLQKRQASLLDLKPKAVIFDESHKLKNPRAQRTEAALAISEAAQYRLCLTGTPVLNKPNEIVPQLQVLGRLKELGGKEGFPKRIGKKRLEQLNFRLRSLCYIRRNKADVLTELPAKQRSVIPLPIDNRDEYKRAEHQLIAWLKEQVMKDEEFAASIALLPAEEQAAARRERAEETAEKARRAEQLVRMNALKKLAVQGKMAEVTRWVEDFLESGEKIVLFAWHTDIVTQLGRLFNAPVITGQTPIVDRQAAVDRFQKDPACRAIALNLEAGGVGLTLTAASNVAFVEQGWTPGLHDQAEDRCHRIGQTFQVNAWYLLAEDTIDMEIQDLIAKKRKVVDAATDGKIVKGESGVLSDLVSKLTGRNS